MLLTELYPRLHRRYSSLPIFGSIIEGFAMWLCHHGYPRHRIRMHVRKVRVLDRVLRSRSHCVLSELTRDGLRACRPACSQDDADLSAAVHTLERYLDSQGFFALPAPPTRSERLIRSYRDLLEAHRGLATSTVTQHLRTATELLGHLSYEAMPLRLSKIDADDIESFIRVVARRFNRESLQHEVAHVRAFMRFLASENLVPAGLDSQIDTPRVYRLERLPRSLPWQTVQAFLRSIDRKTALGRRDYAIFCLIATYGLRASEIVDLTLDDIDWRTDTLRVAQRKTTAPLLLPLLSSVGNALVDYIRHARPPSMQRELFLRERAPAGALKPTAVTEAFQSRARRSGLDIPFQGAHCLRHAYAVHLLRAGTSLKMIGDILGHRSAESTCVYLRLAIEDLRDVALCLPAQSLQPHTKEGRR